MNQMHPILGHKIDPVHTLGAIAHAHSHDLGEHTVNQFLARLGANHRRLIGLAHAEQALADQLKSLLSDSQHMWQIPRLEGEVHDLEALARRQRHHAFGQVRLQLVEHGLTKTDGHVARHGL